MSAIHVLSGVLASYRLEQEVWSNSLVVASFYGPVHSPEWWAAAVVSTAIPMFYCITGGMRASLFTDVFQVRNCSHHQKQVLLSFGRSKSSHSDVLLYHKRRVRAYQFTYVFQVTS